jgi:hypothetical protein
VTQVACDEKQPYHDMYAVWGRAFYVYHSGTGIVERIMFTNSMTSIDLTKLVDTSRYLYGGYYASYGGASVDFVENPESLSFTQVDSISAQATGYQDVTQINAWAASGYVATATDSGTLYTGNAPAAGTAAPWKTGEACDAYSQPGNAADLIADMAALETDQALVYYLKEVPAGDFLQPRLRYTYKTGDGEIGTSWLFTNTDDTNYTSAGFLITNNGTTTKTAGTFETSFVVEPKTVPTNAQTFYVGTAPEGAVNPTLLYEKGAQFSMLLVYNNPNLYPDRPDLNVPSPEPNTNAVYNLLPEGSYMIMYWVTPDGMIVTSVAARTYTNVTNAYSINAAKPNDPVISTITPAA